MLKILRFSGNLHNFYNFGNFEIFQILELSKIRFITAPLTATVVLQSLIWVSKTFPKEPLPRTAWNLKHLVFIIWSIFALLAIVVFLIGATGSRVVKKRIPDTIKYLKKNWDFQLRFPIEIFNWDFQLRFPIEISNWDFQLRFPIEISNWDFQLRFPIEISNWSW